MLPAVRLRESLEDSRASGLDFDPAWSIAMGVVDDLLLDYPKVAAADWGVAFRATRARWQAVYAEPSTRPSRSEAALTLIVERQGGELVLAA